MATFSKQIFSGSTDGKQIKITQTGSSANVIHTGSSTATTLDEVWLYATNSGASDVKLTIQWGGNTSPDDEMEYTVKAENGLYLIIPGLILKGNATPLVVRAFAATANVINVSGYVNRITA